MLACYALYFRTLIGGKIDKALDHLEKSSTMADDVIQTPAEICQYVKKPSAFFRNGTWKEYFDQKDAIKAIIEEAVLDFSGPVHIHKEGYATCEEWAHKKNLIMTEKK